MGEGQSGPRKMGQCDLNSTYELKPHFTDEVLLCLFDKYVKTYQDF